jgi:hypothetical protein
MTSVNCLELFGYIFVQRILNKIHSFPKYLYELVRRAHHKINLLYMRQYTTNVRSDSEKNIGFFKKYIFCKKSLFTKILNEYFTVIFR